MDIEQFKAIFIPLHPKLFRIAVALLQNKDDAEDVVQEVYCKLWDKRDELDSVRNAEAYSVKLLKNKCLDFLRSPNIHRNKELLEGVNVSHGPSPQKELEFAETIAILKNIINLLPEKQRQVVRLRFISECSMEEIEEVTSFSAVNIRTLLFRARKTIKEQFEMIKKHER